MLSIFALALLALPYLNITIDAELRSDADLPGAPLELDLRFAADADTLTTLRHISFPHEELSIGLLDTEGRVLHEPKARPKWYGGVASDRWGTDFADPELQTHRVLVNEWFTTALPAGHYKLLVLLDRIELGFNARNDLYPVDKRWELPFEILPPDDKAVSKMYEALLAECKDMAPANKSRREQALGFLIYAREPLALPYQLDLFLRTDPLIDIDTGLTPNPYYYDLPMRFIESDSPKAAEALVAFLRRLEDDSTEISKDYRSFMAEIILWTIYELHDRSNPDVTKITQPIVDEHQRPSDPRPQPGLDL